MSGDRSDDDELLVEPGGTPRWTIALVALAAAGLLALVAIRAKSHERTTASPSEPPSITVTHAVSGAPVIKIDNTDDPVVAAVLDHGRLTVMRTDSLVNLTAKGKVLVNRHLAGDSALVAGAPAVDLFIDRAHNVGWAVSGIERQARVMTFDPTTMRTRQVTYNNFIVYDAALLDGRLYVATREGIAWLAADGRSGHVPNVSGVVLSVAADVTRDRLLAVVSSAGNPLIAVTPAGHLETVAGLDAIKAQVAVVGGDIWLGGFAQRGAILEKLDPSTLRPVKHVVTTGLGPGAVFVGVGTRDLFVTSGGSAAVTWCVDARTGVVEDVLGISPLSIVSSTGTTIAIIDRQLRPLHPTPGCTG